MSTLQHTVAAAYDESDSTTEHLRNTFINTKPAQHKYVSNICLNEGYTQAVF